MQIIYKFPLRRSGDTQVINTHAHAKILSAQMQGDVLCLWLLIDTAYDKRDYSFTVVGTGQALGEQLGSYVATIQDAPFVWHVFLSNK